VTQEGVESAGEGRASDSATGAHDTDAIPVRSQPLFCPPENGISDEQKRGRRGKAKRPGHGFEIALFIFALVYGFGARGLTASGDPDVALVPMGLAAALALLSAGIALSGWRKARQTHVSNASDSSSSVPAPASPQESAGGIAQPDRAAGIRAWTVIGLTVLYAALFQTLGYVLATLLYAAAVADRFGAKRRTILVLAPGATLLIFLIFRVILGARLPEGLLG